MNIQLTSFTPVFTVENRRLTYVNARQALDQRQSIGWIKYDAEGRGIMKDMNAFENRRTQRHTISLDEREFQFMFATNYQLQLAKRAVDL